MTKMANIPSPPYIIYNVENIVLTLLSKPNRNMFYSQVAIVHLLDKKTVWGTTRKTEFLKKYLYNTICKNIETDIKRSSNFI